MYTCALLITEDNIVLANGGYYVGFW